MTTEGVFTKAGEICFKKYDFFLFAIHMVMRFLQTRN